MVLSFGCSTRRWQHFRRRAFDYESTRRFSSATAAASSFCSAGASFVRMAWNSQSSRADRAALIQARQAGVSDRMIRGAAHQAGRLEDGNRGAHGLRPHPLGPRQGRHRRRPLALQTAEDRHLRQGEIPRMRLLPQPPLQLPDQDPKFPRQSPYARRIGIALSLDHIRV